MNSKLDNMETREDILKMVKEKTGWTDEQCESWLQQEERMQGEIETIQPWVAYYTQSEVTGRRTYKIVSEEDFKKVESLEDYRRCHSKKSAKEQIRDWKDYFRY